MPSQAIANQLAESPGNFLKKNAVKWTGSYPADQQIITVALTESGPIAQTDIIGRRRTSILRRKVSTPFYYLVHVANGNPYWEMARGSNPPTFQVVWSGFQAGQAVQATLPAHGGPGIMLTPTLSGCSVVCVPNKDGTSSAKFSHYNLMDSRGERTLSSRRMQMKAYREYGSTKHRVLSKETYDKEAKHIPECEVTVIGHRKGERWHFWAQYLEDKGTGMQIRRVHKII